MPFERKPILITVPMVISLEAIDNIMVTALEGGINDWCIKAEIVEEPEEEYTYASEIISRGGKLKLHIDDDEPVILDLEKFITGIQRQIEENIENLDIQEIDAMDAGEADNVIQYAVFNELRYS